MKRWEFWRKLRGSPAPVDAARPLLPGDLEPKTIEAGPDGPWDAELVGAQAAPAREGGSVAGERRPTASAVELPAGSSDDQAPSNSTEDRGVEARPSPEVKEGSVADPVWVEAVPPVPVLSDTQGSLPSASIVAATAPARWSHEGEALTLLKESGREPVSIDHGAYWQAYNAADTDAGAARLMGVDTLRFTAWRHLSGIATRNKHLTKPPPAPCDEATFARAFLQHHTDMAACQQLGVTAQVFSGWRSLRGLPTRYSETLEQLRARKAAGLEKPPTGATNLNAMPAPNRALKQPFAITGRPDPPAKPSRPVAKTQEEPQQASGTSTTDPMKAVDEDEDVPVWRRAVYKAEPASAQRQPSEFNTPSEASRMDAYHSHSSDLDAAQALGITQLAFATWRRKRGLAVKTPASAPNPLEKGHAAFLRAYQATASDYEAATQVGVRYDQFVAWRNKAKLPGKGTRPELVDDDERRRAYEETWSDEEAARRLNVTRAAFARWRQEAGLPARATMKRDSQGRVVVRDARSIQWIRLYMQGVSDDEMARMFNCLPTRIVKWRDSLDLVRKKNGEPAYKGQIVNAESNEVLGPWG